MSLEIKGVNCFVMDAKIIRFESWYIKSIYFIIDNFLQTILSLSLCFCNLSSTSGKHLASAVNTSLIRELYLDGNKLECEGVILLLTVITDNAEVEQKKILENNRLKEMILTEGALEGGKICQTIFLQVLQSN